MLQIDDAGDKDSVMSDVKTAATPSPLIDEAQSITLRPDTPVPAGLKVENMRRRGIDQLEITVPHPEARADWLRRLMIFGQRKSRIATVTFAEDHALFVIPDRVADSTVETLVERVEIRQIDVLPGSLSSASSLRVVVGDEELTLGWGLPAETLEWLRERIILEAAGLVSRPLFNVGRRITRKTSNPDEDFYRHWQAGPNKLISVFLEEFPQQANALGTSIELKDWENAAKQCHWMKSSAAAVGAAQLSELCQRMEIDVITMDYSKIESLYAHFERELQIVSETLTRVVNGKAEPNVSLAPLYTLDSNDELDMDLEGRKILLVEDSLVNQEVARFSLEQAGCETFVASDGLEAVAMFQQGTYDLILMDCQMPNMDGFDATRAIRKIEATQFLTPTPIIALTANALKDDRDACVSAGMHDYLSKPYEEHELMEMLCKWLPDDAALARDFEDVPEAMSA